MPLSARPAVEKGPSIPPAKTARQRFDEALAETDRTRRMRQFEVLFASLTAENAAELAAALWENEKNSPFQNDWLEFLRAWARLDPQAAMAFAEKNAGGKLGDWMLVIVPEWAATDPPAATRWWLGFRGADREQVGAALLIAWAKAKWNAAAEWIESACPIEDRPGLAQALARQAVSADAHAVQELLEKCRGKTTHPTAVESALFSELADQKLNKEPEEALKWIAGLRDVFACPKRMAVKCENGLKQHGQTVMDGGGYSSWISWLAQGMQENDRQLWLGVGGSMITLDSATSEPQIRGYNALSGYGADLFLQWLDADSEAASGWLASQQEQSFYEPFAATLALALLNGPRVRGGGRDVGALHSFPRHSARAVEPMVPPERHGPSHSRYCESSGGRWLWLLAGNCDGVMIKRGGSDTSLLRWTGKWRWHALRVRGHLRGGLHFSP